MQTYNDHIKATHQLAALGVRRTLPSRAPETITATVAAVPAGTPVVAVAFKPTSAPALDGVQRVPAFARCDDQHRVNVGKPTAALGWAPGDALVATCDLGRVTVVAAARICAAQQPVTLDGKGRLRVGPAAAAVLRLDPDAHVLAVAVPATGQLVLMPAGPALAALTGPVTVEAPASAAEEIPGTQPRPGSNVRARFRPQVVA